MIPDEIDRAKWARHYVGNLGFGLVSMPLGSKGPRHAGWNDPWNAITDRETAHQTWHGKTLNMGLLHSVSGTATLDIDHAEWAEQALSAIGLSLSNLQQSPVRIRGKNGEKPLYRLPEGSDLARVALAWPHPTDKQKDKDGNDTDRPVMVTLFELRAGPVQDVLPPSIHPDTGKPYEWVGTPPRTRQDIPELPADLLDLWQHWPERVQALKNACPWATEQPARPRQSSPRPNTHPADAQRPGDVCRERITAREALERNGYQPRGERYLPPSSKTKVAGVRILPLGDDGIERAYSDHGSCPLSDGHAHDSFSIITILEYGGDFSAAAKGLARELGLEAPVKPVKPPAAPAPALTAEDVIKAWQEAEPELLQHGFEMLDVIQGNAWQKHAIRDLWIALLELAVSGHVVERSGKFFINPGGITKLRGMGVTGHHADIGQRLRYMANIGFHRGVIRSVPSDPGSQLFVEIPANPRDLPFMGLGRGEMGKLELDMPSRRKARKAKTLHKLPTTKNALPKGSGEPDTRFESALPTVVALLAVPDATTADLAEFRGVGVETVRRHVRMLKAHGIVTVEKRVIRLAEDWGAVRQKLRMERETDTKFRDSIMRQLERTIRYCKATLYTRRSVLDDKAKARRKAQLKLAEQRLERLSLGEPVYEVLGLAA